MTDPRLPPEPVGARVDRQAGLTVGLRRPVSRYLAVADRLLPGRITGFYLVGSAALSAWRPGCSDIDFVAVVDGTRPAGVVARLRVLHAAGNAVTAARSLIRAQGSIPGTMNGAFVAAGELTSPVTRIRPLASHSGWSFHPGRAFDVNPVMWKVLLERGIAVRGPAPADLRLDPEPAVLRSWTLDQLHGHWRRFAERMLSTTPPRKPLVPAHAVALARVLGPPRLHHTIATGEVIAKETAAHYALDTFPSRWHPLIRAALAYRAGRPARLDRVPHLAGEFILEVIEDADRLVDKGTLAL